MGKRNNIPELFIEQLLLDELSEAKKEALLKDPYVLEKLEELEKSNQDILKTYSAERIARQIKWRYQRESKQKHFSIPRLLPAAGLAAVLIVTGSLLFIRRPILTQQENSLESTRVKGLHSHLLIYKKTDSGAEILQEKAAIREKDVLQISYVSGGGKYGAIFSIDGRGITTLHFPVSVTASPHLEEEGEIPLAFAYELDDAPDFERFFFVTSDRMFSIDHVLASARDLSESPERASYEDLKLPEGFEQTSILFMKKTQP